MLIHIENLDINYICEGEGKNILVLHGWGASIDTVIPIVNLLKEDFRVYAVDLPGFGKSQKPKEVFSSEDYARVIKKFADTLDIKKAIVIGHSFGGKISILLAAYYPELVKKLVLIDSAGIRPKRGLKYYTKVYSFKGLKAIYKGIFFWKDQKENLERFYRRFGSTDYKSVDGIMRRVLVKVVNEDFKHILGKIQAPTLLIWGDRDEDTPLYMAKIMEREIKDCGLVVFEGAGHYSYLDDFNRFALVMEAFLSEDRISAKR